MSSSMVLHPIQGSPMAGLGHEGFGAKTEEYMSQGSETSHHNSHPNFHHQAHQQHLHANLHELPTMIQSEDHQHQHQYQYQYQYQQQHQQPQHQQDHNSLYFTYLDSCSDAQDWLPVDTQQVQPDQTYEQMGGFLVSSQQCQQYHQHNQEPQSHARVTPQEVQQYTGSNNNNWPRIQYQDQDQDPRQDLQPTSSCNVLASSKCSSHPAGQNQETSSDTNNNNYRPEVDCTTTTTKVQNYNDPNLNVNNQHRTLQFYTNPNESQHQSQLPLQSQPQPQSQLDYVIGQDRYDYRSSPSHREQYHDQLEHHVSSHSLQQHHDNPLDNNNHQNHHHYHHHQHLQHPQHHLEQQYEDQQPSGVHQLESYSFCRSDSSPFYHQLQATNQLIAPANDQDVPKCPASTATLSRSPSQFDCVISSASSPSLCSSLATNVAGSNSSIQQQLQSQFEESLTRPSSEYCASQSVITTSNSNKQDSHNSESHQSRPSQRKSLELQKQKQVVSSTASETTNEVTTSSSANRKSSVHLPKTRRGRPRKKGLRCKNKANGKLWEFIRDLLLNESTNPAFIRWERREDGVFKFVQSDKVAKMWGERKQNPKMTYEKLSRAMRYYYKSKVLLPVLGRRLVYKFGPNATGWLPATSNANCKQLDSCKTHLECIELY